MSVLSEVIGNSVPHEFIHKGKTYKVGLITQGIKCAFERKLYARAVEAASLMKEAMTATEYQEHLAKLRDDYATGEYAFESNRGQKSLQTIPGIIAICSLLFHTDELDLIKLVNERTADIVSLLQLLLKESFPTEEATEEDQKKRV